MPDLDAEPTTAIAAPTAGSARRFRPARAAVAVAALVLLGASTVSCTPEQVATVAVKQHFEEAEQECALRVVARESNYQADALSPDGKNIGLFQINTVHTAWIASTFGYTYAELTDPFKNAEVARGLYDAAGSYYGDPWQPWRLDGKIRPGGGCPA